MRKKPWELHAIVSLDLIFFGVAISERWFGPLTEGQALILGALAVSLVGLFRGNRFSWWITTSVFAILSVVTLWADVCLISAHGFRAHWLYRNYHALVLLCSGTLGLLLSCRLRGAIPPPAPSFFEGGGALAGFAALITGGLILGSALVSLSIVTLIQYRRRDAGYRGSMSLKTLTSAEADFRANDRDNNGINDFWTGDVQGLYALVPKGGTVPIKLIEYSVAKADGDPLRGDYPPIPDAAEPKAGVWFSALLEDRGVQPPLRYRSPKAPFHPTHFGFVTYPDDCIAGGRMAHIVSENNTIFRREVMTEIKGSDRLPPGPVKDPEFLGFPSDDDLKAKWSKLD